MKCLYFAELLFGVTPVDHLYGMYMDHPCFKVSRERFMYYLVQIPSDLRDCFVSDQYLVSGAWYEIGECRRLLSEQVGRDYYSPSWEEVDELWRENCLTGGDAWKALEEWLRTSEGMGEKLCGDVTCELWNRLAGGTPFDEAALWLAEQLSFMEDEKIQTMMKLLREAAGETRMLFNRGFWPSGRRAKSFWWERTRSGSWGNCPGRWGPLFLPYMFLRDYLRITGKASQKRK